jgi:hypothetical protein
VLAGRLTASLAGSTASAVQLSYARGPGGVRVTGLRARPEVPGLPAGRGAYESFFLKTAAPEGGRALWVRYTMLRYADGRLTGALWFTQFGLDGPVGLRQAVGSAGVAFGPDEYVEVAGGLLRPGVARGSLTVDGTYASWDLSFDDGRPRFRHLRPDRLYATPLPRTKVETRHPASTFRGTATVDGSVLDVDGWRGMVGHNWGAEHAEEWVWLQGNDIGADDCHLELAAGRLLVAGRLTPWVANGLLVLDGEPVRLGGFGHLAGTHFTAGSEDCAFRLRGSGVEVAGLARRRVSDSVRWDYEGPTGAPHTVVNSSVADLSLTVGRGGASRHLALLGGAVYERGSREAAPEVAGGRSG